MHTHEVHMGKAYSDNYDCGLCDKEFGNLENLENRQQQKIPIIIFINVYIFISVYYINHFHFHQSLNHDCNQLQVLLLSHHLS